MAGGWELAGDQIGAKMREKNYFKKLLRLHICTLASTLRLQQGRDDVFKRHFSNRETVFLRFGGGSYFYH